MSKEPSSAPPSYLGHRSRLRQRLERETQSVADYEVLELLLGYALTRKDTKPLAKELLARFGSLRGALDARPEELLAVPGIGAGVLALWRLQREVFARYVEAPVRQKDVLATPEAVASMAQMRLAGAATEELWIALLTKSNTLIAWERLRKGNVDSIPILPRDVLEVALQFRASSIILVHNHPGGSYRPSQADIDLTEALDHLARQMRIGLLDHIIVTDDVCYSIKQRHCITIPKPTFGA